MRTAIVLLLLTALIQGPAWATSVGLFADPAGTSLTFNDTGSELLSIYVVVINTPGAAAVGFSAPLPDCFLGASYLTDTFVYPITLGNSQTGIGIGFGTCITGPIHVLTIHVLTAGLTERCCPYPVIPDPRVPSGWVEWVDCADNLLAANGLQSVVLGSGPNEPIVSNRFPADGAAAQPLDTQLSWTTEFCPTDVLSMGWCDVFFGTTPDPPTVAPMGGCGQYDPGVLLPNTTYYWKLRAVDYYGATTTRVWSFTTEGSISTKIATWGAIKEMMK